jgi:hypothetical protein
MMITLYCYYIYTLFIYYIGEDQYHSIFELYELCLRQRRTSLSAEASAWKLKLKLL